jgi:hypothetical protein
MPPNGYGPPGPPGSPEPNQPPQPVMVDTAHPAYTPEDDSWDSPASPPQPGTFVAPPAAYSSQPPMPMQPVASPPQPPMYAPQMQPPGQPVAPPPVLQSQPGPSFVQSPPPAMPLIPAATPQPGIGGYSPVSSPMLPPQPAAQYYAAASPYAGAALPQSRPRRRVRVRLFVTLAVAVAVLAGGAAGMSSFLNGQQATSADILFQQALENAMQTKNYTQTITNSHGVTERKVDVSDIKNPKVSSLVKQNAANLEIEGYATLKDTFVQLKQSSQFGGNPKALNTWIQVRKNGAVLDQSGQGGQTFDLLFTPMSWLFESLIHGNYEQIDRATFLQFIREKYIFRYDATKATETSHNGQEAMRYTVVISSDAHNELFKRAAELAGISKQDITVAVTLANLTRGGALPQQYTLYVDAASQRFVKAEYIVDNQPTIMLLNGIEATQVGEAPAPAHDWNGFMRSLK